MAFITGLVSELIIPALTAGGAAASAGLGIANAVSGTPKAPTVPGPTPPNPQQLLQQRQAVSAQDSNLQEAGSGDLGANFLAQIAPNLAGISGQPGANAAGSFGANQNWTPANSQPINAAVQGQPFNLSDFINGIT